jgi:hypothetical protein
MTSSVKELQEIRRIRRVRERERKKKVRKKNEIKKERLNTPFFFPFAFIYTSNFMYELLESEMVALTICHRHAFVYELLQTFLLC